jgi:hypothetical protein
MLVLETHSVGLVGPLSASVKEQERLLTFAIGNEHTKEQSKNLIA